MTSVRKVSVVPHSLRVRGAPHTHMESLRGKLLIASPAILDPNFRQTVVLLAEHTDEGAMGIVLNREGSATVGEAVPDLAYLAGEDDVVHVGGPVSANVGDRAGGLRGARSMRRCSSTTASGSSRRPSTTRTSSPRPCAARAIFAGHAGWGPGQLEAEMEEESWIVEPARQRGRLHDRARAAVVDRCCAARAASTPSSRRCPRTRR